MNGIQEEIEIEIDRELLETITAIANKQGLSAEQYISNIIDQYVAETQCLSC